ncbi:Transcription elongation factor spt5 [Venturia nashicola]|uniref:Transcription elongation factor SPT5 n=1 Tax=Venturia nashicola TaxID=86259 RepID=A0A4Z1PDB1_9PEZI|nr:Transcription elongation factor spt5 [Venturia nashicola]
MNTNSLNQDHASESEDDDFNPAPQALSDDEDAAHPTTSRKISGRRGSDDEDEAPSNRDKATSRRANDDEDDDDEVADEDLNANGEDEDDDGKGDDLDEEEEDEEEDEDDRPRKRAKRDRRMQFIDAEAEVDDDDEEDELDDDEIVADEVHPDDLLDMPAGVENDDRRHRELDRQRDADIMLDAQEQAKMLKAKYGRMRSGAQEVAAIPQHLLLPSVSDPMIWAVRCKAGKEAEIINQVMRRCADNMNASRDADRIQIFSCFARGGSAMSGYIYVEATQTEHVYAATDNISFCYARSGINIIDIKERPDLLHTIPPKPIEPGMWVRIKKPQKYAGDLAQVSSVEDNGSDITLKIIPRIDYGTEEDINAPQNVKRKRPLSTSRPQQRLFNEQEARKKGSRHVGVSQSHGKIIFTFQNENFIDGFLEKDYKLQAVETEDVHPTLEEVSRFSTKNEEGGENLDLASIAASLKNSSSLSDYLPGDNVEIYQGEQQGVKGKAIAVHGDIVTLAVRGGPLNGQRIDAPVKGLRKVFNEGDHVKVIGGSKYFDETGMVLRFVEDRVTLLANSNNEEITVFSKDLREATDSGGSAAHSDYAIKDLVQLDASTVAVIIKVQREHLQILDQEGRSRTVLPTAISQKIEKRRNAVATDREGSEVRSDDTVKEWSGEQRTGMVIHVHRNYLFVWNKQQAENAGMFVVRSANVQTVVAKGGKINSLAPDLTKMNPALQNKSANGGAPMGPPKSFGRDKMIGKTVTIAIGAYKGLLGIVKDTTDDKARVELHTKNKVVTVAKTTLRIKDPITGQSIAFGAGRGRGSGPPGGRFGSGTPGGSRVPEYPGGSRTPAGAANGGRTPAWGMQQDARTPAWQQGGRTPAQAQQGGRTPAWSRDNDGSRTAYGGNDGSRTSYGGRTEYGGGSWNARTPFAGNSGFSGNSADDYNSGSKTPAWGAAPAATPGFSGSRTPAHPSAYSAPTPGASYGGAPTPYVSAPTPGAYNAPTPGAMDGPTPRPYGDYQTPGGAMSAPTPGAYPETPGAFAAQTPGGDYDDDPGYN